LIIQSQITNAGVGIQCGIEIIYTLLDEICIHFLNKPRQIIPFCTPVAETLNQIILLENNVFCFAIETTTFFTLMAPRQTVVLIYVTDGVK
jgi:hypothetical protein